MVTRNAKICQNCFHRRRQSTILGPRSNAEKTSETTFRSRDTAAWGLRAQKLMIPSKNSRVPEIISSQKRCFGLANPSQRARQRHPFGPGSRGTLSTAEDNGSTLHHSKMLLISTNQSHKPDQRANQEEANCSIHLSKIDASALHTGDPDCTHRDHAQRRLLPSRNALGPRASSPKF